MCGRFALAHIAGFWSRFAVVDRQATVEARFNIAPSQMVPVITRQSPNRAIMMKWGLVPFWAKDPKIGNKLINARAETVDSKPAFRTSLKRRRCLVPATGFYEWKRAGKEKVPYYIHLKDDDFFSFAGLYDSWSDRDGNRLMSFTIITIAPNDMMAKIHNRMPAILRIEDEETWLGKEQLDEKDRKRLLGPFASRRMEAYEVSKEVNSPTFDSEELVKPVPRNR
jgi:putative SOS response-associated peptidase YedK